ncbi:unnamed protein product [Adineta ricciae]|uniref:Uncharacterized protein n=1 Tax=Adineta ricciae TaxID=249248 RepID=A0A815NRI6_ADIRI|nr:unnamed protein product [Adineta ricciae]
MSTTPATASKTLKNSCVLVFDGNSDTINECLRRHLRKLEKTNRTNKKNARKGASHPTKLVFLIYFDDGVNEQKGPISRPTPPISPFNRLSVSSTSLPLVSIPPRLIPLATTTTCLILPIVLPPSSPAAASPTITSPSSPTAMETVTSNKMQFICSITKENEPAWLIGLKQFHHDALRPVDKQIQRLSDDHRIVEDHLNEAEEMITSTAEQKKQLDEECRPGQWFLK